MMSALPMPVAVLLATLFWAPDGVVRVAFETMVAASAGQGLGDSLVVRRAQLQAVPDVDPSQVTAVVTWRHAPRAGLQTVQVTFVRAGEPEATVWAQVQLAEKRLVAVARRDLAAGTVVANADVELVFTDAPAEARASEVVGGRLTRDVHAGELVVARAVTLPPPVRRGTPITVIVRAGAVTVAAPGKLERDAYRGERIPVRLDTGRLIAATLIDETTAEIVRGGSRGLAERGAEPPEGGTP